MFERVIDHVNLTPLPYPAGTRGPPASDVLVSRAGFVKNKARSFLLCMSGFLGVSGF